MFGRSWRLLKSTWAILQQDKELATFPLLSGIAVILVSVVFGIIALMIAMSNPDIARALSALDDSTSVRGEDISTGALVVGVTILFVYYLIVAFITNYLAGALIGAALIRLRGGDPTVGDGFRIARGRLSDLFGFSVIAATVGLALSMLRGNTDDRNNPVGAIIGAIAASLLEMAWSIATFLVIPVIVDEQVGPFEAIRRSTALLKRTFGEQIVGGIGLGLIMSVFYLVTIFFFGAIAAIAGGIGFGLGVLAAIVVGVIALAVLAVIGSTLGGIYKAAVYHYAQTGEVPTGWESDMVRGAFKPKVKRAGLFGG